MHFYCENLNKMTCSQLRKCTLTENILSAFLPDCDQILLHALPTVEGSIVMELHL